MLGSALGCEGVISGLDGRHTLRRGKTMFFGVYRKRASATTLIAARDLVKGAVDVDECVRLAAELYCRLTAMKW